MRPRSARHCATVRRSCRPRLDGAIIRARNAVADTTADQYDDPTLLDKITRTLDHYDAYDPHLPANIDPSS